MHPLLSKFADRETYLEKAWENVVNSEKPNLNLHAS
jgi:hypothetical protein